MAEEWRIKPVLASDEADALEALAAFAGAWIGRDGTKGAAVPGAAGLCAKLVTAVKDIRESTMYANEVGLEKSELTALVFFGHLFSAANPTHAGNARLARWIQGFAPLAEAVTDYTVGRTGWQYAAKSARRILIVSGRNRKAHNELLLWLKDLHLEPVVLKAHATRGSATTPEALESAIAMCGTGIVLVTPDDEGRLAIDEDGRPLRVGKQEKLESRTRQNVVLELGMLWGHLGRDRIILLQEESVVLGTDTLGSMTIRFAGDVTTAFDRLRQRLQAMGIVTLAPKH